MLLRHFSTTALGAFRRGATPLLHLNSRLGTTPSRCGNKIAQRLCVRMMSADGQIYSELMDSMRRKIQEALGTEDVQVTDVQGDGRHVEIVVVSSQFEGKSSVNRQRMVYKVSEIVGSRKAQNLGLGLRFCGRDTSDHKGKGNSNLSLHCSPSGLGIVHAVNDF